MKDLLGREFPLQLLSFVQGRLETPPARSLMDPRCRRYGVDRPQPSLLSTAKLPTASCCETTGVVQLLSGRGRGLRETPRAYGSTSVGACTMDFVRIPAGKFQVTGQTVLLLTKICIPFFEITRPFFLGTWTRGQFGAFVKRKRLSRRSGDPAAGLQRRPLASIEGRSPAYVAVFRGLPRPTTIP